MSRDRLGIVLGFGLTTVSCSIGSFDQNASTPTQPVTQAPRSETRLEFMPAASPMGLVALAYNDSSEFTDGIGHVQQRPTGNGYSYSVDRGQTWTRLGNLPLDPGCTDPQAGTCVIGTAGDPWLAFDGNALLHYSSLAGTRMPNAGDPLLRYLPIDAVAVAHTADGRHWTYPDIAAVTDDHDTCSPFAGGSCQHIDKPSIAAVPQTTTVGYVQYDATPGSNQLKLTTSDFGGPWTRQALQLGAPPIPSGYVYQNPIIRLRNAIEGYLAWLERRQACPSVPVWSIRTISVLLGSRDKQPVGCGAGNWCTRRAISQLSACSLRPIIPFGEMTYRQALTLEISVMGWGHIYT